MLDSTNSREFVLTLLSRKNKSYLLSNWKPFGIEWNNKFVEPLSAGVVPLRVPERVYRPKQKERIGKEKEREKAQLNVGGSVGGTQFDCFFIAIILAPSSTARAMAISPPIRAIIRVLDRFLYRGLYHCPCCVARRVGSRRVLGGCAQNAPSPRHSTRKENRSLPLHNCILRNVTVIGDLLGDHRFVSIETPPQNLGILNRDISDAKRSPCTVSWETNFGERPTNLNLNGF